MVAQATSQLAPAELHELLSPDTGLSGIALREGRTAFSPDVRADPRVGSPPGVDGSIGGGQSCALLAVPLAVRGVVLGVLAIGDIVGRTFDLREIRLAEAFADYAAITLTSTRAGAASF